MTELKKQKTQKTLVDGIRPAQIRASQARPEKNLSLKPKRKSRKNVATSSRFTIVLEKPTQTHQASQPSFQEKLQKELQRATNVISLPKPFEPETLSQSEAQEKTETSDEFSPTLNNTEPAKPPRWLVILLCVLAYGIPLAFFAYVLYINFLPIGYDKTFTIDVGVPGDANTSHQFYLEPSPYLSEPKTEDAGTTTYRELSGITYAVYKPNVVLNDAELTISAEGDNIAIIPPYISFDPASVQWDYAWDFSNGNASSTGTVALPFAFVENTATDTASSTDDTLPEITIVDDYTSSSTFATSTLKTFTGLFTGNAFMFDGAFTFNGRDTRMTLPNSVDMFENGPMSIYVEWTPQDQNDNMQQIVGHYNWELWQHKNSVEFRVGRMDNATGTAYSIKYPIDESFFDQPHSALAIYNPGDNGYIELFVDNNFVDRVYFASSTIWREYGGNQDLSLGWTPHNNGKSTHFAGSIHTLRIISHNVIQLPSTTTFTMTGSDPVSFALIPAIENKSVTLKHLILHVVQK